MFLYGYLSSLIRVFWCYDVFAELMAVMHRHEYKIKLAASVLQVIGMVDVGAQHWALLLWAGRVWMVEEVELLGESVQRPEREKRPSEYHS